MRAKQDSGQAGHCPSLTWFLVLFMQMHEENRDPALRTPLQMDVLTSHRGLCFFSEIFPIDLPFRDILRVCVCSLILCTPAVYIGRWGVLHLDALPPWPVTLALKNSPLCYAWVLGGPRVASRISGTSTFFPRRVSLSHSLLQSNCFTSSGHQREQTYCRSHPGQAGIWSEMKLPRTTQGWHDCKQ